MNFNIETEGSLLALENILQNMIVNKKIQSLLILACDSNSFTETAINKILKNITLPIFGGIFSEIIYKNEKLSKGTIVVGFSIAVNVQILPNLSETGIDFDKLISNKIPDIGDAKTMFIWVDRSSKRINELIDSLFNVFGLELNYIGGGAGSVSSDNMPCLFTNEGLIKDSAVLALLDIKSGIGVQHGWKRLKGPFRVTETDGNIIKTLDGQPAFEIYKSVVEKASGKQLTKENFFEVAKGYPFGIPKIGSEPIVRDPISLENEGALKCVGDVPIGYVDILFGNVDSLIKAARKALDFGIESFETKSDRNIFIIDCISRVLFLEDNYEQELNAIYDEKSNLFFGVTTLGEIANSGKEYLEFYNKTLVVTILEAHNEVSH